MGVAKTLFCANTDLLSLRMNREGGEAVQRGFARTHVAFGAGQRFRRREGYAHQRDWPWQPCGSLANFLASLSGNRLAPQLGREPSRQGQFLACVRPVALDLGMRGRKRGIEELDWTSL